MEQHKITIEIDYWNDMPGERYVASIKEPEYRGIVVQSNSIANCLKELSISLDVLEKYRKNNL